MNTREMIREFNKAFGRPVNGLPATLTVGDRELLGKLIFEECLEYLTKGLGLAIGINNDHAFDVQKIATEGGSTSEFTFPTDEEGRVINGAAWGSIFHICLNEGQMYDPVESADGLADMNVVIHFNSHWHGFNLDALTAHVHESNMSKLSENGTPIINGVTPGYRPKGWTNPDDGGQYMENESGYDPAKPIGKILKGSEFLGRQAWDSCYIGERKFLMARVVIMHLANQDNWIRWSNLLERAAKLQSESYFRNDPKSDEFVSEMIRRTNEDRPMWSPTLKQWNYLHSLVWGEPS